MRNSNIKMIMISTIFQIQVQVALRMIKTKLDPTLILAMMMKLIAKVVVVRIKAFFHVFPIIP
jgi:hypothetical protein